MARQFFSGNTVEQAVLSAASHYGIEPESVNYKLRDKKHGFLKTRRRVVIEVDPTAPAKDMVEVEEAAPTSGESIAALDSLGERETTSSNEPEVDDDETADLSDAEGAPGNDSEEDDDSDDEEWEEDDDEDDEEEEDGDWDEDDEDDDEEEDDEDWDEDEDDEDDDEDRDIVAFERATDRLIDFLDLELEYEIERRDDLFEIELSGDDAEVVTADEGKVLEAIEHLLPRLVRGYVGHGLPCRVDCEGFRAARQQDLLDLADEAAAAVREAGRGLMLEPMNPADRRVVHLALADDPDVRTESEGDGYLKRVRILPTADLDEDEDLEEYDDEAEEYEEADAYDDESDSDDIDDGYEADSEDDSSYDDDGDAEDSDSEDNDSEDSDSEDDDSYEDDAEDEAVEGDLDAEVGDEGDLDEDEVGAERGNS